jgi:uncharacterized lipoprotein YbaY
MRNKIALPRIVYITNCIRRAELWDCSEEIIAVKTAAENGFGLLLSLFLSFYAAVTADCSAVEIIAAAIHAVNRLAVMMTAVNFRKSFAFADDFFIKKFPKKISKNT